MSDRQLTLFSKTVIQLMSEGQLHVMHRYIQHGSITTLDHSLMVAYYSWRLNRRFRLKADETSLIRGALLHDYFLYDWHKKDRINPHRLHGFFHPGTALANASREYALTPREKDIIKKHMWPLTIIPPMCREAWIVTAADKWCSFMETLRLHKGHGAVSIKREQGTDVRKAEESVAADKKRVEGKRAEIIG